VVAVSPTNLSAGMLFSQQASAKRNYLILDNAQIFGGVAKRNEFVVDGQCLHAPQASVHFQPPYPDSFLERVYAAMGLDWDAFKPWTRREPAAREALRNGPFGRIAFSHADLSGAMDHRNSFMESHRAVSQLLERVLT
jgi:hypothetical protein